MRPRIAGVAGLLLFAPLSGCCAIAEFLFCDARPPMPRREYLTPNQTLKTFLHAVASDDARTIWESIGPDMKRALDVDEFRWQIAWEKIKDQTPGIHQADRAEPREPEPVVQPATATRPFPLTTFTLTVPLATIEVRMRKYFYWTVVFQSEDMNAPEEVSAHVPALGKVMRVVPVPGKERTKVALSLPGVPWNGLMLSEVRTASAGIEWLIYDFRVLRE